jgi:hypothetical protein
MNNLDQLVSVFSDPEKWRSLLQVTKLVVEPSRCKPEGITDIFYPKDFKNNPYQIWNFGLFL